MLHHADFSPDGTRLITASDDHSVRVWDLRAGENLQVFRHDDEVNDANFSHDGLRIVTASKDKTARVWDAGTGALLFSLSHSDTVWRAVFSPDGASIATACQDQTVQLWNGKTGERVGMPLAHESAVGFMVFSADGRLLGSATAKGVARIWDVAQRRECVKSEPVGNNGFDPIAFSPDNQKIAIAIGTDLRVWNTQSFQELPFPLLKSGGAIEDVAFSADSKSIVSCALDFTAQLWNADTGQPLLSTPVHHSGPILEARISPDGRRFVTAGQDAVAQLWSTRTGEPIGPSLKHILHVKFARFNPDGRRLLFNSCDQAARLWDLATSDLPAPVRPVIPDDHRLVSPNGQYQLTPGEGNILWLTELGSGRKVASLTHANPVTYASFSPDGRSAVTASEEHNPISYKHNDIFIWEVPGGRRLNTSGMSHDFRLLYIAFSPGNRDQRLLTCGFDFTARVWDARTGQPKTPVLRHRQRVHWGAFSPDGLTVATASWDKTVRVWDAETGNPLTPPLLHRSTPAGAFWSADKKRLHTLTEDGYLQVWDLATGEPLTPPRKTSDANVPVPSGSPQVIDDLPRDARPVEDLVALGQTLAVARISSEGNMVPLEIYQLQSYWQYLRKRYPNQFSTTSAEMVAWHDREARESATEGNTFAQAFHLKQGEAARLLKSTQASAPRGSDFPSRDPMATADQIDLTEHYNLSLHDSLNQKPDAIDLSQLPEGLQQFDHIVFDIRGLIHLSSQGVKKRGINFPDRVVGIQIRRKCRLLHFLEASSQSSDEPKSNPKIGAYVLHYADGQQFELPITYGSEVADWWEDGARMPGTASPVWNAPNRNSAGRIRIYKNIRQNPRPNEEVVSMDFVSKERAAAPFLIALTIE